MPDEFFETPIQVVEGLVKAAKSEALVIMTLYSPFMWAAHLDADIAKHLEEDPEAVKKGRKFHRCMSTRFLSNRIPALIRHASSAPETGGKTRQARRVRAVPDMFRMNCPGMAFSTCMIAFLPVQ